MHTPRGATILALLSAIVTLAFGQTKNLTIEDVKTMALQSNLNVIQAQNNIGSAQGAVLAAYGSYLPTLSASAGFSGYQNDRPATQPIYINGIPIQGGDAGRTVQHSFSSGLNLNYLIFDGFSREGSFSRAKSNAISVEQIAARTRQSIVFQVESSYLNVLRSGQLVSVNVENLKRDSTQLEKITESNKVGSASLADVYRQQSTVASDELGLIQAQNTYDKAKADLLALIGLNALIDYTISDPSISTAISKEELATSLNLDLPAITSRAMAARLDYQSAAEQLHAAESGVTAAKGGYFPLISASAGYTLSTNSPDYPALGDNRTMNWSLNLRWNIFDAFQTNMSIQSAVAVKRNAEVNVAQTERGIDVDVKKAILDLDAARKQYDVSQKGMQSATEDYKIAQEKYTLGAGTLLDLSVASANLVNAQANVVNASYNFITFKRNLEYVIGERSY